MENRKTKCRKCNFLWKIEKQNAEKTLKKGSLRRTDQINLRDFPTAYQIFLMVDKNDEETCAFLLIDYKFDF